MQHLSEMKKIKLLDVVKCLEGNTTFYIVSLKALVKKRRLILVQ